MERFIDLEQEMDTLQSKYEREAGMPAKASSSMSTSAAGSLKPSPCASKVSLSERDRPKDSITTGMPSM